MDDRMSRADETAAGGRGIRRALLLLLAASLLLLGLGAWRGDFAETRANGSAL